MSKGKLPVLNTEKLIRLLFQVGFVPKRKKGSHLILVKDERRVVVPIHEGRDVPPGTLLSIIKQAGLSKKDFINLLKN